MNCRPPTWPVVRSGGRSPSWLRNHEPIVFRCCAWRRDRRQGCRPGCASTRRTSPHTDRTLAGRYRLQTQIRMYGSVVGATLGRADAVGCPTPAMHSVSGDRASASRCAASSCSLTSEVRTKGCVDARTIRTPRSSVIVNVDEGHQPRPTGTSLLARDTSESAAQSSQTNFGSRSTSRFGRSIGVWWLLVWR